MNRYILGCDIASEYSEDHSAFALFDRKGNLVRMFTDKIPWWLALGIRVGIVTAVVEV